MPANIVKTRKDERLWRRAKALARRQGKAGDFAYVTGIFEKLKGK